MNTLHKIVVSILATCIGLGVIGGILSITQYKSIPPLQGGIVVVDATLESSKEKLGRVLFIGDMMFDRTLRRETKEEYALLLAGAETVLREHDIVVGNLEGPVTTYPSKSVGTLPDEEGNTTFTFPPHLLDVLRDHHVSIVSIGNNHIRDFGADGLAQTRLHLAKAEIRFVGDPDRQSDPVIFSSGNVRIGLVSYNEFFPPAGQEGGALAKTRSDIEVVETEADFTVVYAHWGDEYVAEPPASVRAAAHAFVDAGADLVIGSHPHVVQPVEHYRGATIYYSLGNFAFDQYWDESVKTGLGVSLSFNEAGQFLLREYTVRISPRGGVSMKPADKALPPLSTVE